MESFTVHEGTAVPLRNSNVDTDQIIPAEYLKRITRTGFADGLFAAWRHDPNFVLNQEQYIGGTVLVTGPDFGTGSSREHAVWALQDYGFRVVISARFADIFRSNAGKNGLLPAIVDQQVVEQLWELVAAQPDLAITVDLEAQQLRAGELVASFEVDPDVRWRLLEGLDDIDITMENEPDITAFEASRPDFLPRTA